MCALTNLDISNTGIGGTLPEKFAAFQELQEFRAVNCPGISGTLPPAWGLLKLEVLKITNSALTGGLPPQWADVTALQQAALAVGAVSLEAKAGEARATAASHAIPVSDAVGGMPASFQQHLMQSSALGMQRLRVLDLSVSGPSRGGLTGGLPASFAQLEQLQVSCRLYAQGRSSQRHHQM
jgi:hypothetical protein